MALTNCPNCGNKVSTRAKACPHCGKPLNSAPKNEQLDNPKKKSKGLIIALISVLGLGVLGGGGWALYKYVIKPNPHHHNLDDDKSIDKMSSFEDGDSIPIDSTDLVPYDVNQNENVDIQNLPPQNYDGGAKAEEIYETELTQNKPKNQGTVNEPTQPQVSSSQESPIKEQVQPKKETKPQAESSPQAKDTQRKEDTKVKDAFEGRGNSSSSDGSSSKNKSGSHSNEAIDKPSIGGGLEGYTANYFPTAPCPGPGTVVVRVTVTPNGSVSKASIIGGSLSSNSRACSICLGLARRSTFRVPQNTTTDRTGTITYSVK